MKQILRLFKNQYNLIRYHQSSLTKIDDEILQTYDSFCLNVFEKRYYDMGFKTKPKIINSIREINHLICDAISKIDYEKDLLSKLTADDLDYRIHECFLKIKRKKENFDENTEFDHLFLFYKNELDRCNCIDIFDARYLVLELFSTNPEILKLYKRQYYFLCFDIPNNKLDEELINLLS